MLPFSIFRFTCFWLPALYILSKQFHIWKICSTTTAELNLADILPVSLVTAQPWKSAVAQRIRRTWTTEEGRRTQSWTNSISYFEWLFLDDGEDTGQYGLQLISVSSEAKTNHCFPLSEKNTSHKVKISYFHWFQVKDFLTSFSSLNLRKIKQIYSVTVNFLYRISFLWYEKFHW